MPAPTSRFKTNFEKGFENYLRTHYAEHHRRITEGRKSARWALFSYPMSLFVAIGLPVAGLTVVASLLYTQNPSWFGNVLNPESARIVMPILYGATGAAAAFGLFLGISLGLGKARNLIFESERHELQVRQTYFLRRLTRSKKQKHSKQVVNGASTASTVRPRDFSVPTTPRFAREQDINVAHEAE